METKTWHEVANEIKEDKEINFIGRAISPLHVLGIESYILHLKDKGVKLKGFILAVSHSDTGMLIAEDTFHKDLYEGVEPIFLVEQNDLKVKPGNLRMCIQNVNNEKEFYLANPYRPEFSYISEVAGIRPDERINVVVTDEGNGSYVNDPYRLHDNKFPSWSIKDFIRFIIYSSIRDRYLYKRMASKGIISRFLMLKKENGSFVRNTECAEKLVDIFKSVKLADDYTSYEDSILICPSLIYEAGVLKEPVDIEIYREILNKLGNPKCVVKPHPREKEIEKYRQLGCMVERRYSATTEVVLANLERKPRCIIGESSTVLVSAAALFGIKTISISKLINRDKLTIPDYFDRFSDIFGRIVLTPETSEELIKILENI